MGRVPPTCRSFRQTFRCSVYINVSRGAVKQFNRSRRPTLGVRQRVNDTERVCGWGFPGQIVLTVEVGLAFFTPDVSL